MKDSTQSKFGCVQDQLKKQERYVFWTYQSKGSWRYQHDQLPLIFPNNNKIKIKIIIYSDKCSKHPSFFYDIYSGINKYMFSKTWCSSRGKSHLCFLILQELYLIIMKLASCRPWSLSITSCLIFVSNLGILLRYRFYIPIQ